jgi:hypothetical protein
MSNYLDKNGITVAKVLDENGDIVPLQLTGEYTMGSIMRDKNGVPGVGVLDDTGEITTLIGSDDSAPQFESLPRDDNGVPVLGVVDATSGKLRPATVNDFGGGSPTPPSAMIQLDKTFSSVYRTAVSPGRDRLYVVGREESTGSYGIFCFNTSGISVGQTLGTNYGFVYGFFNNGRCLYELSNGIYIDGGDGVFTRIANLTALPHPGYGSSGFAYCKQKDAFYMCASTPISELVRVENDGSVHNIAHHPGPGSPNSQLTLVNDKYVVYANTNSTLSTVWNTAIHNVENDTTITTLKNLGNSNPIHQVMPITGGDGVVLFTGTGTAAANDMSYTVVYTNGVLSEFATNKIGSVSATGQFSFVSRVEPDGATITFVGRSCFGIIKNYYTTPSSYIYAVSSNPSYITTKYNGGGILVQMVGTSASVYLATDTALTAQGSAMSLINWDLYSVSGSGTFTVFKSDGTSRVINASPIQPAIGGSRVDGEDGNLYVVNTTSTTRDFYKVNANNTITLMSSVLSTTTISNNIPYGTFKRPSGEFITYDPSVGVLTVDPQYNEVKVLRRIVNTPAMVLVNETTLGTLLSNFPNANLPASGLKIGADNKITPTVALGRQNMLVPQGKIGLAYYTATGTTLHSWNFITERVVGDVLGATNISPQPFNTKYFLTINGASECLIKNVELL